MGKQVRSYEWEDCCPSDIAFDWEGNHFLVGGKSNASYIFQATATLCTLSPFLMAMEFYLSLCLSETQGLNIVTHTILHIHQLLDAVCLSLSLSISIYKEPIARHGHYATMLIMANPPIPSLFSLFNANRQESPTLCISYLAKAKRL